MNRISHFDIPTGNPKKAMEFYETVFGWTFSKWQRDDYWLIETGPDEYEGINGGLLKRNDPGEPVTNTIEVEDIDRTIDLIRRNKGEIVVPISAIPFVGFIAYFKDIDGNILGLFQNDENAR